MAKTITLKRVVVTGLGALTPIGNNVNDYWNALIAGTSGAAPITRFDASKHKTKFACELKNFSIENYMDKKEARHMDPFCQYGIVAADEAIKDAGIDLDKINKDRIGVIWGSGNGGIQTFEEQLLEFAKGDGTPRYNPYFIPKILVDMAAGLISIKYGFRGINHTTVSACATSNTALVDAFNFIRLGKNEIIITGGSEAPITPAAMGGFNACKALSTLNENPAGASRPFDKNRDGFVMGEGAGAIILEDLEHALARGAKIYAEIAGGGLSGDAYHMTGTHPDGAGAILAMKEALLDAEISVTDIDYINTHGTSTPIGDISEIKAIISLFGEHAGKLNISSTKSMTGHLLGAAGAIEGIAGILALKNGIIPPTINTVDVDEQILSNLNLTLGKAQKRNINYVMSNTFGFGGHNAIAIFKRFEK